MGVMFEEIGVGFTRKSAGKKKAFELLQEKIDFLAEVIKLALGRSQTLDSIF